MRKHLQGRGHPPALLFLTTALVACVAWAGPVWGAGQDPLDRALGAEAWPDGPMAFRMDGMRVDVRRHSLMGEGNVVVQQNGALLCCDHFEARTGTDGAKSFVCRGRVRGDVDGRLLFANCASYSPSSHLLTFTGRPRMTDGRTQNRVEGSKMVVNTLSRQVHIDRPLGHISLVDPNKGAPMPQDPSPWHGPVPDVCPLTWVTP